MDNNHDKPDPPAPGTLPRYCLGLQKVEIAAVLEACELVGHLLRSGAPEANASAAARLLTEASRDEHHDETLTRSILVQVARTLQRRS